MSHHVYAMDFHMVYNHVGIAGLTSFACQNHVPKHGTMNVDGVDGVTKSS